MVVHHAGSDSLVIAVGDGLSAATASHDGAVAVCRYAVAATIGELNQGRRPDWTDVIGQSASALVELARRAGLQPDVQTAEKFFATTLLVALLTPDDGGVRLTAAGVGDTSIWTLRDDRLRCLIGSKHQPSNEPFSAAVFALPRLPESINELDVFLSKDDVVLVVSDGIGDPLGDGSGLIGGLLKSELKAPPPPVQVARIADFSRATFSDDRTLVAVWQLGEQVRPNHND